LTRRARELGVAVAAGTDALAGERDGELPNLHRELELLVHGAGFSPLEAITAATRNSARALGAEDTRGTIGVGKLADLVVLRADPSADIRNTREIELVVKRGRVIEASRLR
jgi:imidazolonepropionase-like amidohydrolase